MCVTHTHTHITLPVNLHNSSLTKFGQLGEYTVSFLLISRSELQLDWMQMPYQCLHTNQWWFPWITFGGLSLFLVWKTCTVCSPNAWVPAAQFRSPLCIQRGLCCHLFYLPGSTLAGSWSVEWSQQLKWGTPLWLAISVTESDAPYCC